MNVENMINFLSELALVMPNSEKSDEIIKSQPIHIQKAIRENDSETLRQRISKKNHYAHEVNVTIF